MRSLRRWALATAVLAAGACSDEIPLPEEFALSNTINARVAGTEADDIWWPVCDGSLALNHWTGSWEKLQFKEVACPSSGAGFVANMAVAAPGRVWFSAGERLLLIDGSGKIEDHSADAKLGGRLMFGNVFSFGGVAVVMARHDPGQGTYDKTVMLRFENGSFTGTVAAPEALEMASMLVIGANDLWASVATDGEPSWQNGFAKPMTLWHFDGQSWHRSEGTADLSTVDPRFSGDDLWDAALQHFDGTIWQQVTLPAPQLLEGASSSFGARVMPGSDGGLVLVSSMLTHASGDDYLSKGRNIDYGIQRWQGSDWAPFESFAHNVTNTCASPYICGVTITGFLEDGTIIGTQKDGDGSDAVLVPFKP